jgi:2,3-bisphosphoglycerate-independent phosphoglycerate mutase
MNCILVRDAGNKIPHYTPINQKYKMNVGCVVDMPVEIGISEILGMEIIKAGNVNDYVTKAKVTAKELQKYDMVYVHIKGPDEFGHDGDALGKKQNIERIDMEFFGTLLKELKNANVTIVVSGDHSTPCIKKSHTDDPVPLLISPKTIGNTKVQRFTESYAKKGAVGSIMGSDVLNKTLGIIQL